MGLRLAGLRLFTFEAIVIKGFCRGLPLLYDVVIYIHMCVQMR